MNCKQLAREINKGTQYRVMRSCPVCRNNKLEKQYCSNCEGSGLVEYFPSSDL